MRALLAVTLAVALLAAGAATAGGRVVIGSARFAPAGEGWGTVKPHRLYNGGVPSGDARRIHWRSWGGGVARGHGITFGYKPGGGYYRKPVRIKLRAHRRGRCSAHGPRAYKRLSARVQKRPGGRFGRWFLWSGQRNLCHRIER